MNPKIFIASAVLIAIGAGGFFVYQNLSKTDEPAGEEGTIKITEEGVPTGEEETIPNEEEITSGEEGSTTAEEKPAGQSETPIETPKTETPEVKSTSPIDSLSNALIAEWGANCRNQGNTLAITSCLLDWQKNNIFWCYTNPEAQSYFDYFSPGYPDCVVEYAVSADVAGFISGFPGDGVKSQR